MHVTAAIALPLIYAVYLGIAEAARALALDAATKRRDDPTVQRLVGEMENELTAARLAHRHMLDVAARGPIGAETTGQVLIGGTLVAHAVLKTTAASASSVSSATFRAPATTRCASPHRLCRTTRSRTGCQRLNRARPRSVLNPSMKESGPWM